MKKEKVVGVRLTEEQYNLLDWIRVERYAKSPETKSMSSFIASLLEDEFHIHGKWYEKHLKTVAAEQALLAEAEAKAKAEKKAIAKAKRDAKKAANDPK